MWWPQLINCNSATARQHTYVYIYIQMKQMHLQISCLWPCVVVVALVNGAKQIYDFSYWNFCVHLFTRDAVEWLEAVIVIVFIADFTKRMRFFGSLLTKSGRVHNRYRSLGKEECLACLPSSWLLVCLSRARNDINDNDDDIPSKHFQIQHVSKCVQCTCVTIPLRSHDVCLYTCTKRNSEK